MSISDIGPMLLTIMSTSTIAGGPKDFSKLENLTIKIRYFLIYH